MSTFLAEDAQSSPRRAPTPNVGSARNRQRYQAIFGAGFAALVTACTALIFRGIPDSLLGVVLASIVVVFGLAWLWAEPVRGVYVFICASVMQETGFSAVNFTDDIGRNLPFFQDISTWSHIKSISISVAELLFIAVFLIWILKDIAYRRVHFHNGALMLPLGLYMLMVAVGEVHGLASGGDFKKALWEVRPQTYMLLAYILTANLIRTRRQVDMLVWIVLIGAGLKGVQGTWRYFVTLHRNLHGVESLFPHEQSYYFNAFLLLTPILFLFQAPRWMKRAALYSLPFVVIASLTNQRRAAVLALAVAIACLLVVTVATQPRLRRAAVGILFLLMVAFPPYYINYQDKGGLIAQPARAIASSTDPNLRDSSSDLYRTNEDHDILAMMRTSPLIGVGFGKPMATPYPLADISKIYSLWNYLPHNSILWILMRMGVIGYAFFWWLIAASIVLSCKLMLTLREPFLRGLAVFIMLMIIQEVIFGYLDLQWANYRNLITMGVLFGLLGCLPNLAAGVGTAPTSNEPDTLDQSTRDA